MVYIMEDINSPPRWDAGSLTERGGQERGEGGGAGGWQGREESEWYAMGRKGQTEEEKKRRLHAKNAAD